MQISGQVAYGLEPRAPRAVPGLHSTAAMKPSIYLDHAATTPVDPRVFEAMVPYLRGEYGNPSSVHRLGRRVRVVIEECRERVAAAIGAEPAEIIFTSGGTEADNLAILGIEREGAI